MIKVKRDVKEIKFLNKKIRFGERALIMGILNVTPDSFSDGGSYVDIDKAIDHAKEMISLGADIIDIGGESSRPGHKNISTEEELNRVIPVVKRLATETDTIISLDTIRAEVADEAIKNGVHIINDIWGLQRDPDMAKVAAKYNIPVIVMHNQGGTSYNNMIEDIKGFFYKSIEIAREAGLSEDMIILDPGIGFGKTSQQNIQLMSQLDEIKSMGYPVLLGTSRKSMIGSILDLPPKERLEGTIATTVLGIAQGMDIIRVHDVTENLRAARVADAIIRGE